MKPPSKLPHEENDEAITLGDVTVTRITESEGFYPITMLLHPRATRDWSETERRWRQHWDPEQNEIQASVGSYLLAQRRKEHLIDTGGGTVRAALLPARAHLTRRI